MITSISLRHKLNKYAVIINSTFKNNVGKKICYRLSIGQDNVTAYKGIQRNYINKTLGNEKKKPNSYELCTLLLNIQIYHNKEMWLERSSLYAYILVLLPISSKFKTNVIVYFIYENRDK